jgi:hypothetical protein
MNPGNRADLPRQAARLAAGFEAAVLFLVFFLQKGPIIV